MEEIRLGAKARDRVTGLQGIIIGHAKHLTGCDTYGIAPAAKDDRVEAPVWFDESRIEVIGPGVALPAPALHPNAGRALVGGPQPTPTRHRGEDSTGR